MEIIPYEKKYLKQWEDFVASSNNGTIFHTRKFLSYHPPERFKDSSVIFTDRNKVTAVMTGLIDNSDKGVTFISHRGASFGGFVFNDDLSLKQAFELTGCLIDFCKNKKISRIVITHSPFIYQRVYNNYVDFAFMKSGFAYLKREVSSIVSLDVKEDDVFKLFKPEARTAARKAGKSGVVIKQSGDFDEYYSILKNNLALRHNAKPAHSLAELKHLHELFPRSIYLIGAYLKNKLIAGVVNFECNPKVVLVFYISHDPLYQNYRAVNLLFYEIMKDAISKGFSYLDFGLFTVNMEPNWGLGRFKENFGARGILRDTFYLDL